MAKEICTIFPLGSCLKCFNKQFIVYHRTEMLSLTNPDGEIIDVQEISDYAIGKCINCGKEYKMIILNETYIPSTPLREILYKNNPYIYDDNSNYAEIKNPMECDKK